jgi:hypothetical protein
MALAISKLATFSRSRSLPVRKEQPVTISVSPRKIALILTLAVVCLCLANLAGQYSKYFLGHDQLLGLVPMFDLDAEANVPTWFSTSILLLASFLLSVIACMKRKEADRYFPHWAMLSLVFLFLSVDEAGQIHEFISDVLHKTVPTRGLLFYSWVIPYGILSLFFALSYLRFLFSLPAKIRNRFIMAGILYVGGALGMDFIEGRYAEFFGDQNMTMALLATVEESCEMMGVILFSYALMSYLSSHTKGIAFQIGSREAEPVETNTMPAA